MRILLLNLLLLITTVLTAQVPINWVIDEVSPGMDIHLIADGEKFTEGNVSCRMQLNSGAVPYLISDRFNVNPGADYQFSLDAFDNDTTGQLKVYCDFFDAIGNIIFGEQPLESDNSGNWQTIQWSGIVPPDAAEGYVLIKFYCEPNPHNFVDTAFAWVDNCSFSEETGGNLVINGSFEDWAVGVDDPADHTNQFQLYPNPVVDFLNIKASDHIDFIRINDFTGRIVKEEAISGMTMKMDVSLLPQGLYIITFYKEGILLGEEKLIK